MSTAARHMELAQLTNVLCEFCGERVTFGKRGWRQRLIIRKPLRELYECANGPRGKHDAAV